MRNRILNLLMGVLIAVVATACSSGQKPSAASQSPLRPLTPPAGAGAGAGGSAASAANAAAAAEVPMIPPGARFTLQLTTLAGPDHREKAKAMKAELEKLPGFNKGDWHIVHGDGSSVLQYGFYRTINAQEDKKEADRAHADRQKVASMTDRVSGERLFPSCALLPLDSPDPVAPAEWNLVNAKGTWTLEIAIYKDHADRKQAAVDTVKAFREQKIEAYFYHGPNASSVCIGAWPAEAIQKLDAAQPSDPSLPFVVGEGVKLPEKVRTPDGEVVQVVQPKMNILDPTLEAAMRTYPEHAMNGYVTPRKVRLADGSTQMKPEPSVIVQVPRPAGSMESVATPVPVPIPGVGSVGQGSTSTQGPPSSLGGQPQQPQPAPAQGGRLRRIGE